MEASRNSRTAQRKGNRKAEHQGSMKREGRTAALTKAPPQIKRELPNYEKMLINQDLAGAKRPDHNKPASTTWTKMCSACSTVMEGRKEITNKYLK